MWLIRADWQLLPSADFCDRRLDRLGDFSGCPVEFGGGFAQWVGDVEGCRVGVGAMGWVEPGFAKGDYGAPADRRQLAGGGPVFAG